jgi:phytoene dehydrogenase-like protein
MYTCIIFSIHGVCNGPSCAAFTKYNCQIGTVREKILTKLEQYPDKFGALGKDPDKFGTVREKTLPNQAKKWMLDLRSTSECWKHLVWKFQPGHKKHLVNEFGSCIYI